MRFRVIRVADTPPGATIHELPPQLLREVNELHLLFVSILCLVCVFCIVLEYSLLLPAVMITPTIETEEYNFS